MENDVEQVEQNPEEEEKEKEAPRYVVTTYRNAPFLLALKR